MRRSIVILTLLLSSPTAAHAERPDIDQQPYEPSTWHLNYNTGPEIELESSPTRVEVKLLGSSQIGGVTPFSLPGNLRGRYRIEAYKPGFEYSTKRVDFVQVNGEERTRPYLYQRDIGRKIAAPPGWFEWREGGHAQGLVLLSSEALDLTSGFYAHQRTGHYASEASFYRDRLDLADGDDAFELELRAQTADRRASAWSDARTQWFALAGALWGISALGRTVFEPGMNAHFRGDGTLELQLLPVSRSGTVLRSALLPGWGQSYSGRSRASRWFISGSTLLMTGTLYAHQAAQRADVDVFHADQRVQYYRHIDADKTADALRQLEHAESKADQASTVRYTMIGATLGLWAYNVVDAMLRTTTANADLTDATNHPTILAITPTGGRVGVELAF